MTENRRIRPGSLLLLLLVVCVFILARSMNSSGTVAYSDMCRYFREEKVQSFTITGDVLKAKLQDGTLTACTIGSVESFYSDMDGLIQQGQARVKLLPTQDQWFGVTYKEDKQAVADSFKKLIGSGVYRSPLFDFERDEIHD